MMSFKMVMVIIAAASMVFTILGSIGAPPAEAASMTFTTDTTITTDQTISAGETWTVNEGVTLTVNAGVFITNNGEIDNLGNIDDSGFVLNYALFNNDGNVNINSYGIVNYDSGTLNNDGLIHNILGGID